NSRHVVGIINAWGALRTWQTHMVAHAKWYKHIYSYLGVIEALAGLPFNVRFLSFDDVLAGIDDDIAVLINAGTANTAFSGGSAWNNPHLVAAIRAFVARGGGFIGVGEPSAYLREGGVESGTYFQLADVLGVDREIGWSLSTNRYPTYELDHDIAADLGEDFDAGERVGEIYPTTATVVRDHHGSVDIAANHYGAGHAVYFAGLPYSTTNARTLHRAIIWAATGAMDDLAEVWTTSHPDVEVASYPHANRLFVYNSGTSNRDVMVNGPAGECHAVQLAALESSWISLNDDHEHITQQ
ncbi:MAG: lacto-N-biose phosphorylase central domain-containing protein, partial [Bowdeniella nasicola]|nr:lacto-N-biose phosphorylase central domain-containing protein [Bowdeniella nasicola]